MSTEHGTHPSDLRPSPKWRRSALAVMACSALLCLAAGPARAGAGTVQLLATYTSVCHGWQQVELWQDTYAGWPAQQYPQDGRDDQTGQRQTFFGAAEPPGSQFLLYYAPGWNTGAHAVPVLLVMGASDNVDREYADPDLDGSGTCGSLRCPTTGLMQYLSGDGYEVFAVNLANPQGDNYQWAQSIAEAIQVVRQRTGAAEEDLLAWSKGAFAARMYVAGVAPSCGRPYQSDMRKLILLGGPSDGVVFEASCLDTTGIPGPVSTALLSRDNHLQLGWEATAQSTILGWLGN